MRRIFIVAVLAFGFSAAPAHAHVPLNGELSETLQTEHFQIHFTGSLALDGGVHATIRQYVGEFAATAEWAHDTYRSWGYPAYVNDGDNRIDVYVHDFEHSHAAADLVAFAEPIGAGATAAPRIDINVDFIRDPQTAAHQAFHALQMAMYAPAPDWFAQATADWAAFRLRGYPIPVVTPAPPVFHQPDASLDCDPATTTVWPGKWVQRPCGLTGYEAAGYTRWTFFQYLQERFGADIVKDAWTRVQTQASPSYDGDDAVRDALAAKNSSLTDVFNDYSIAMLTGNFQTALLKNVTPVVYATVITPESGGAIPELRVAVNRLASRFVSLKAPVQTDTACYEATLGLTITLPANVTSRPHIYATKTKTATALSVSGTTATATIPWDTCSSEFPAYLSLPNSSQSLDARTFVVNATVTVDKTKVMTKTPPPAAATVTGIVIAAPTEDPAPTIYLYAPEVLRVAADASLLRLVVFSTGAGRIRATFNGSDLGTSTVRAGANDLRFRLPAASARRVLASQSVLELTALSPTGAPGTTFVQKIAFAKPKPKKRRR
jgi:hypothetical protein